MSELQNVTVEIKNFKKIKELKQKFEAGNVYIIGGDNEIGKTSLLQALKALGEGKCSINNKVSDGEAEGQIKGEFDFSGANGGKFIVKYDFTNDKDTFKMITPSTEVLKSTPRNNVIADAFKFNSFTVDEWFAWGLTSEGRKKQAQIVLNLLPEALRKEYETIELQINEKSGVLYLQRASANKDLDHSKKILNSYKLTEEEIKLLANKEPATQLLTTLKKQLEDNDTSKVDVLKVEMISLKEKLDANKEHQQQLKSDIEKFTIEIERLQDEIRTSNSSISFAIVNQDSLENQIELKQEEIDKLSVNTIDTVAIKERIDKGQALLTNISIIEAKQVNYNRNLNFAQIHADKATDLDTKIKAKRARKIAILEENKLPVTNITIQDGEAMYIDKEGLVLPFNKDNISYSAGGMVVIELMAHINKKLPIWLVGSAESYDNNRLTEIQAIADKYKGVVILDKVVSDGNKEITITVLEK